MDIIVPVAQRAKFPDQATQENFLEWCERHPYWVLPREPTLLEEGDWIWFAFTFRTKYKAKVKEIKFANGKWYIYFSKPRKCRPIITGWVRSFIYLDLDKLKDNILHEIKRRRK